MSETGDPALLGRRVAGKFLVEKFLGGGAMGAVYRAKDSTLDRRVALKVMHPAVAMDPSFVTRFHREARAASRIDHASAMRVIEFGEEPDGLLFIAMEYLEGRDLYKVIHEDWPLSEARIADMMMKALGAMQVAHDMGVIHRDLKPENIMILDRKDDEGQDIVKVCDFGIAKITEADDEPSRKGTGAKLTTTGLVVGTPEYMSPEQARGEKLDPRSDLYSMGIILYQLLTGRTPFLAETALAVVLKHITEIPEPPSVHYPAVHKGLESICVRALAKAREDRFQSARDMRTAVRAVMEGRPIPLDIQAVTEVAPISEGTLPRHSSAAPAASRSSVPTPMTGSGTSKITPLGTVLASASPPSSRAPIFAGVALGALALGALGFVFVRPMLLQKPLPTPTPSAITSTSAKAAPSTAVVPVVATGSDTTQPPPTHTTVRRPPATRMSRGSSVAPEVVPVAIPEPAPEPAPGPAPAPAPAPIPAPAPAPALIAFNAATCKAVVDGKKSVSGYNVADLRLANPDAAWTTCARGLKEKPAAPIKATVHLLFSDSRAFNSATCAGCPAAITQCVTAAAKKTASVVILGGDATNAPAFDVSVTFSCD